MKQSTAFAKTAKEEEEMNEEIRQLKTINRQLELELAQQAHSFPPP